MTKKLSPQEYGRLGAEKVRVACELLGVTRKELGELSRRVAAEAKKKKRGKK